MREIVESAQFKRDLKKVAKTGRYARADLLDIVAALANDEVLAPKHHDHFLTGNWKNHKECHIKSDWLLIYMLVDEKLTLVRTGSHSELLG